LDTNPLKAFEQSTKPGERITDKPELPTRGLVTQITADTESIEGEVHLKVGTSGDFEVFSDEPPHIGGTNRFPPPMRYIALGIGF